MFDDELQYLKNLGFSSNVVLGAKSATKAAEAALRERERYFSLLEEAQQGSYELLLDFAWEKPTDGTKITRADIIATVVFFTNYLEENPTADFLTEEREYLPAWPHIYTHVLNETNWHFFTRQPQNSYLDGIDGSVRFENRLSDCGVWAMGVSGWAVFASIPSSEEFKEDKIPCPFVSIAEVGVGVAVWDPDSGWKKVDVKAFKVPPSKVGHGITIHTDPRYAPVFEFLKANGGSEWVFSIGHAIGREMSSGMRGLYIHGELAPHDFHPARVFLEAMNVEHFTFVVDPNGKFSLLPPGCQPTQYNPILRFGICGGYDAERVKAIKLFILQNLNGNNSPSSESTETRSFFTAAGSHS